MTTLNLLLRRWAELEPLHCEMEIPSLISIEVGDTKRIGIILNRAFNWQDYAATQTAVQKAIAARPGWDMELQSGYTLRDAVVYFGTVRHENGSEFVSTESPEPAIALLDAYIKALEAFLEALLPQLQFHPNPTSSL
jgi:hypothetical protein